MIEKKPWVSKTLWINAVVAVAALVGFPVVGEYINAHAEIVMGGFAVLNFLLRLVTKEKISLTE